MTGFAHRWTWRALTNAQWECACPWFLSGDGSGWLHPCPAKQTQSVGYHQQARPMSAKTAVHMVAVPTTAITRKTP